jgi:hypothetical protein
VWRSLAARFVRDEEAAGSNPATPTEKFQVDAMITKLGDHGIDHLLAIRWRDRTPSPAHGEEDRQRMPPWCGTFSYRLNGSSTCCSKLSLDAGGADTLPYAPRMDL